MIGGCTRTGPRPLRSGRTRRVSDCNEKVARQLRREQCLSTMTAGRRSCRDVRLHRTSARAVSRDLVQVVCSSVSRSCCGRAFLAAPATSIPAPTSSRAGHPVGAPVGHGESASAHDMARRNTRVRSVVWDREGENLGASRLSTLNRRLEGVSSTKRFAASMAR